MKRRLAALGLLLVGVTVVGAVICAGEAGRTLTMENVNVFGSPKGLQFEFAMGWGGVAWRRVIRSRPLEPATAGA